MQGSSEFGSISATFFLNPIGRHLEVGMGFRRGVGRGGGELKAVLVDTNKYFPPLRR
jgi:hypothetical protein